MAVSFREEAFETVRTKLAAGVSQSVVKRRTAAPVPGRNVPRDLFPKLAQRVVWLVQRDADYRPGEKPGKQGVRHYQREHRGECHIFVRATSEETTATALNALSDDVEETLRQIEKDQREDPKWRLELEAFEAGDERLNQGPIGAGLVRFRIWEYT